MTEVCYESTSTSAEDKPSYSLIPDILYENRHCNQEGFSILICGGQDKNKMILNRVFEMKVPRFEVTEFPSIVRSCYLFDSITIGSDILAIGANTYLDESLDKFTISVEIYSEKKLKF